MKKILILSLFAGLLMTSCDWHSNHYIAGHGDVVDMEVSVPPFTGISVSGQCDVQVEVADTQFVELSAQSQILDVLTYEVRGGVLNIGVRDGYSINTDKGISASIIMREVDFISITGAGSYVLEGSRQSRLDIVITGSGNVDALDLPVEDCSIEISGAGDCQVNVIESLDVSISGVGNVYYSGAPELTTDVSGVGNIEALDR